MNVNPTSGRQPWSRRLALALGWATAATAAGQTYVLNELPTGGAANSKAYGINVTGQVVGWTENTDGERHAAHWLNEEYTDLHNTTHLQLLQIFTVPMNEAFTISDGDRIVGAAQKKYKCTDVEKIASTSMLLRPAVSTDLATPYPGDALADLATFDHPCIAFDSAAVGISNGNHVVGWADFTGGTTIHAYLIQPVNGVWYEDADGDGGNDLLIDLGTLDPNGVESSATAVNDDGVVVGWSYTIDRTDSPSKLVYHAFRIEPAGGTWFFDDAGKNGLMEDLGTLGGANSWARGINNAGQIVGESDTANGTTRAFLWAGGVMTDLGTLGGANSSASRINDSGDIVGWAEDATGERHACAWIGSQIIDLNSALLPNANATITLTEARDINENGEIVGWGRVIGAESKLQAFHLRIATPQEIEAAEAEALPPPPDEVVGDGGSSDDDDTGGAPSGSFPGIPLLGDHASGGDGGSSSDGDDADGDTSDGDGTAAPATLCGAGLFPLVFLPLAGLLLRRGRC